MMSAYMEGYIAGLYGHNPRKADLSSDYSLGYTDGKGDREELYVAKGVEAPGDMANHSLGWGEFVDNAPLGTIIASISGRWYVDPLMQISADEYRRLARRKYEANKGMREADKLVWEEVTVDFPEAA